MARQDGMPRPELIFVHSGSADGCNARRVPAGSVSSDLKIASNSDRLHRQSPTAADAIEDEVKETLGAAYFG
jgi:hypothetical protein